ncbi:MAG: DUF4111 domain-containing protein [Ruminiclostridium sp.]|nr:DUF4111 domain-containing protein [Ruminiclostridium sp.]
MGTDQLLEEYTEASKRILKDRLVGIYLHGSAVMGCFNPSKSDIDIIVVVNDTLSEDLKRKYMDMVTELNAVGPAKGIEMSIVRKSVCSPFVYPTPFELHFSAMHSGWYHDDPEGYIRNMNGTDKDLAAHFTIIRKRGKCLYGEPKEDIFGEVPVSDYIDSIRGDIEDAAQEIQNNTMYLTLNLARVSAYLEEGLVLSKKEGGEWALKTIPTEYTAHIRNALREYTLGEDIIYDPMQAKSYAEYMLGRINSYVAGRHSDIS